MYDDKGRRTHSVNEIGQVTKYLYDELGRLETVYYPYSEEKANADKQEAAEAGLFFTLDKGNPESVYLASAEGSKLKAILEEVGFGRSGLLTVMQTVWKESYTYDANSNRLTKTTAWGTIDYNYDSENRLVHSGVEGDGTAFSYDANGNLLIKDNAYKTEEYAYNSINRMAQSVVVDNIEKTQTTSYYGYDAFGRRTLVQDEGFATMRTLYDGLSFDIIRENEVFGGGDFTTSYMQNAGIQYTDSETSTGRYRYIEGGSTETTRYRNLDGYTNERSRFTGTKTALYAKGESVAVNRSSSTGEAGGRAYFGTDILGSVRSATTDASTIEERYEYDAFGTPYKGDFSNGLDGGYTGKPYDATTGLYNYGFRDYSPQTARFTTVDPIRDGNNWFSYVVNDPVNYVDLWGLEMFMAEGSEYYPTVDADVHLVMENSPTFKKHIDTLSAETNGIGQDLIVEIDVQWGGFEFEGNTQTQLEIIDGVETQLIVIQIDMKAINEAEDLHYLDVMIEEFVHASHAAEIGPEAWNTQAKYENDNFDYHDRQREKDAKLEVGKIIDEHNASCSVTD